MSIYKRGGRWWISVSVGGHRIRRSTGAEATKADAKRIEAQLRHDLASGKAPAQRTLDEAALRWWDTEGCKMKSPSMKGLLRVLLPYIEGKPLQEAPAIAQDATRDWNAAGLKPATIARRLQVLKRIVNVAYRHWGWLENPVADRIHLPKVQNERHVYLTHEQIDALVQACPIPDVADAILLAAYTGLRKEELLRLMNGELTVRNNCVVLDGKTKSGRPRVIPLPPQLDAIVKRLPIPMERHRLYVGWDEARKACGLGGVVWHDLRHTYASWLVQSGAPIKAVQDLLGHADLHTTQRYAHLAPEHLADAVARMAAATGANVSPIKKRENER